MSPIFILFSSFSTVTHASYDNHLEVWQTKQLNKLSAKELQLAANFIYLSYAIALAESKIRQFQTPISRLNQSIRKSIIEYKNPSDDIAMLKKLMERLSYIIGARAIYTETLKVCTSYYGRNASFAIHNAIETIQQYTQETLSSWANKKAEETSNRLKKTSDMIGESVKHFEGVSRLHKEMSKGILPIEIPKEYQNHQELFKLNIVLSNNPELLMVTEEITNILNETSNYAEQLISTGAEIYKQYYNTIHKCIVDQTFNKQYATTMFGMHDLLPEDYKTPLPDAEHVFEHMLQTTKLYTQTELLH